MNNTQTSLYFYEWGRARDWYLAHGIDPKQADAKRHSLHKQALGRDKSSKDFTNSDLDKVLAAFRAISDGGNLDAQLDQIDQPHKRRHLLEERIFEAGAKFLDPDNREKLRWATINYVTPILKSLGASGNWPVGDEAVLKKLMGIMERRADQVEKAKEPASKNPF